MGYASKSGRARTNPNAPASHAICDRCGCRVNFTDLQWQFDYRGRALMNLKILVCRHCLDKPQDQLRAIILPPDPQPIINARVEDFVSASTDYLTVAAPTVYDPITGIPIPSTTTFVTDSGLNVTSQPIGPPDALQPGAVMPLFEGVQYGVAIPVMSIISNGNPILTVTCSQAHGLSTNAQVSFEGLKNNLACGIFSITVTTATAFTYQVFDSIPAGSLLTPTSLVATALVGIPYGYTQIPIGR